MTAPNPARRRLGLAVTALLGVCIVWGSSFLLMEIGTDAVEQVAGRDHKLANGAFFLAVRFVLAVLVMPIVLPKSVRNLDRATWIHGFWLATIFSAAFLLQIFGLAQADIHPSQSAYLTSLYVVATPLLASIIYRKLPPRGVLIGVPLAMTGAAFIGGPPDAGLSIGAWSTIACAILFGGQILLTDHSTRRVDPLKLTFTMLVLSAGWMILALVCAPGGWELLRPSLLSRAFANVPFVVSELICSVLATVVAVSLYNRWQKELDPSRAALLYTTEPVFASLISIGAGRDRVTGWLVFGSLMILSANVVAELVGKSKRGPATA